MPEEPNFGRLEGEPPPIEAPRPETPFRIAILGDFSCRSARGEVATPEELAERRPIKVDRDDLDATFARLEAALSVTPEGEDDEVDLRPACLDDLEPDEIFERVDRFEDLDGADEQGELMRAILRHPDVRALESAWRGLDWLLKRSSRGGRVDLVLIDLSFAEFLADLGASEDLEQSGLYQLLVEQPSRRTTAQPWGLFVGLFTFDVSAAHAEALGRMGKIAARAGAPFLSGVGPRVLEKAFAPEEDDAAAWEALRAQPEAALLGLATPRFLLRVPYGEDTKPIERFSFEEFSGPDGGAAYLWGHPALAVAALLAQSFHKDGWAFKPNALLDLDHMPLHSYRNEDDDTEMTTLEAWPKRVEVERAGKLGIMCLLGVKGRDAVQLNRVMSLAPAPEGEKGAELAGPWGQEGMVKLPGRDRGLVGVGVGLVADAVSSSSSDSGSGSGGGDEDSGSDSDSDYDSDASSSSGSDEMDPELAALLGESSDESSDSSGSDEMDPELAALLGGSEDSSSSSSSSEEMDPELAALLGDLGSSSSESAPESSPGDDEMDPELAKLLKDLG